MMCSGRVIHMAVSKSFIGGLLIGIIAGAGVGAGIVIMLAPKLPNSYYLTIINFDMGVAQRMSWLPPDAGVTIVGTTAKNVTIAAPANTIIVLNITAGIVDYWLGSDAGDIIPFNATLFWIVMNRSKTIQPHWY